MQARSFVICLVLAALAACSSYQDGAQPEGMIVVPGNFKAGSGTISAVAVLPNANKKAAAGGSNKPDPNLYRLSLQMDNGGFQQVDVDSGTFMAGQAVELTNDGRVVHVSGTTLNQVLRR
ncbi:MAG TPA: hypothetical protein VM183_00740 [Burkholderiales bacterium]|nr:hypothetical protein [Burkholderiales bacterium]